MTGKRPTLLSTVAILCIVLGSIGVLSGGFQLLALVFQDQIQNLSGAGNVPAGMQAYNEQMQAISERYTLANAIGGTGNLVTSVLLIVGGSLLLARRPSAPDLMLYIVIAAIVVGIYTTVLGALVQMQMLPLMEEMAASVTGNNAEMRTVTTAVQWVGFAFALFWLICKLTLYIATIVTVRKPAVRAWCAGTANA